MNLIQVIIGKLSIRIKQDIMPSRGTTGTNGHLKGLLVVGLVFLKIKTPPQTMMKAASVPILVSSAA